MRLSRGGVPLGAGQASEIRYGTIAKDLALLVGDAELDRAVILFHAPPHETSWTAPPSTA